ncbi:MAG: hypothetical protein ABSE49_36210, partial [Polyangiaceae bacterium]
MTRPPFATLVAPLVAPLVLAGACSSTSQAPPDLGGADGSTAVDSGGTPQDGTVGGDGAGHADGGEAGEGSVDGGEVGLPAEAEAGEIFAPECMETSTWSNTARVTSIAPAGFDHFGSISANELSVAWTTAAGDVYVADRTSATGSFGTPELLTASDGGSPGLANDRVALDPTATQLI